MATIGVWTDLEGHVGLWCGCFPALQPVIRVLTYKLGLRSNLDSYADKPTAPSNTYGAQQGSRAMKKQGYLHQGSGIDKDGDNDSQKEIWTGNDVGRLTDQDVEMGGMRHGIRKNTEVRVLVEDTKDSKKGARRQESWVDV
jgi:hypothetical protein